MLATFCLRLAWGMAGALLILSPAQVAPRFYRVQFLTVLGLGAVALVDLRTEADVWLIASLIAALALAFAGSFVWSLEGHPGGVAIVVLTVVTLGIALGLTQSAVIRSSVAEQPCVLWGFINQLTSAALLGTSMSAMLMGHSYLVAPAMSIQPLLSLLRALFAAVLLRAIVAGAGLWSWTDTHSLVNLESDTVLLLPVRWGLGLVGPLVFGGMAWASARIRSTQSATGILYVVVIFCFLGELTSQVLQESKHTL